MRKVEEYLNRADDWRKRAERASNDGEKKAFEDLAAAWELLADTRRKQIEEGVVEPRIN